MSPLSALFIGGTGLISSACTEVAQAAGIDVTVLNRGVTSTRTTPEGVHLLRADIRDQAAMRGVLGDRHFDVVVNFIAFTPDQVRADIELFEGRVSQYLFISSAAGYQTPPLRLPIVESTPLRNPFWDYARDKIECEDVLVEAYRARGFPVTIVRPSHTYDRTSVPLLGGWTNIERMRRGDPVVVHGDGAALWVLTHHRDVATGIVGLLGNLQTTGDAFHVTSDEILNWNQIFQAMASAAGVEDPQLVHVSSRAIEELEPDFGPPLFGDRTHSVFFDNTKIKSVVPGFSAATPWAVGAREIVGWHDADPARGGSDPKIEALIDDLIRTTQTLA